MGKQIYSENLNYSIYLTVGIIFILFVISLNQVNFLNILFIGHNDLSQKITGDTSLDKVTVQQAGEANFTIMLMIAASFCGLTFLIYNTIRYIEKWIKKK